MRETGGKYMATKQNEYVIALEEHYWDKDLIATLGGGEASRAPKMMERLYDIGEIRIREMDAAGIDMQLLSHGAPSGQKVTADIAEKVMRGMNDRLAAAIKEHPTRFAGFAALPTAVPEAAADELERSVTELGFKGAMICGLTNGHFHDEKQFWPIFERAEKLDVPIYMHPSFPDDRIIEAYYKEYIKDYPMVMRAAWGYTVETATQAIRMVLSGMFEQYPKLKIVLGHMGETLPYQMWRIDQALKRPGHNTINFREVFSEHFWITTSGHFSTPALLTSMMEMGSDKIMFAVDWPFVANEPAMEWFETVQISSADRKKILSENAKKLLKL
jgi:predicted TIM-barrel fold metal-dependent hydrolase